MTVIRPFDSIAATDLRLAGGKGANLGELTRAGLPVPPGFVITTAAYDDFLARTEMRNKIIEASGRVPVDDHEAADAAAHDIAELFAGSAVPDELITEITAAYADLAGKSGEAEPAVAVRSSATAEDLGDASFAGQQDTYLNIRGADALVAAVRDCWASLWTPRAIAYRGQHGVGADDLSLAVAVQLLIDADAAGVLFTANPTNGRRDETVIAAAWGLGESVVGGSVTTDSIVLRRNDDQWSVRSREIADKQVQTVRTATGTTEVEVPVQRRRAPVLTEAETVELADLGHRVAEHYGRPMDLEWARDKQQLWLLQARPVTALPDPVGDPPTDWTVPDRNRMYFRASIVEMMPEPLTPLFGDLIEPAVVGSLQALFSELIADVPEGMTTFPTINGYAYYGYSWKALGYLTWKAAPLMLRMFRSGQANAETRWGQTYHPDYLQAVSDWAAKDRTQLTAAELLAGVRALLLAGCRYYTGVQQVIPVAAMSETTFTKLYRTLRRPGDPEPTTYVLGLESSPMRAERELYRLARWCVDQPELLAVLGSDDPHRVVFGDRPDSVPDQVWWQWQERIGTYLQAFGHTISDLDFANPVAADEPSAVIETLRYYTRDGAADPTERQRRLATERERASKQLLDRLDPVRRRLVEPVLRKAQEYGGLREDALADVGLAWPLIRSLLAELGGRLRDAGVIEGPDDVYWLTAAHLDLAAAAMDRGAALVSAGSVEDRKMTWRGRRTVSPPQLLPKTGPVKLMEPWMPSVDADGQHGPTLRGLGASGGTVTARACVITDRADFARMEPGMIIVAKITTPAYTPLFAMAGGVVTDVGGPLSHSSIVAREYGIPAVLGTGAATQRIKHGDEITVDGTAGTVTLAADEEVDHDREAAVGDGGAASNGGRRRAVLVAAGAGAGAAAAVAMLRRRARRRRPTGPTSGKAST
ncbi:phosphoenolpyruvate synthase [Microlunatus elymi]|uniref:Phosphoenolpyruvate synthase n=1 Tax=Microlunatus elymi TaxID=2596828 RepID=A0A516Q0T9_9ACTN|nr:PEP/pyruvate-binding domain-containing protein [Microlunatus elymi]QDP97040.1 phosphoenolpyruvate synthase [Microlunatus elymi]